MKKLIPLVASLLLPIFIMAQVAQFEKKEFIRGQDTLRYRMLYPENYKKGKKYPVIFFLHGSGERGNDNTLQLKHGSSLFLDSSNRKNFPAFVIFPQCPSNSSWAKMKPRNDQGPRQIQFATDDPMTIPLRLVSELMDSLAASRSVNKKKMYVGGLSLGGFGTFDLLARKPHFFAAAFPICGAGDSTTAVRYGKNFPIWVFHGGADPVVNVSNSRTMVAALTSAGARVKYSEYPGVGHNSWDNAFAEPMLLPWLFKQKK